MTNCVDPIMGFQVQLTIWTQYLNREIDTIELNSNDKYILKDMSFEYYFHGMFVPSAVLQKR